MNKRNEIYWQSEAKLNGVSDYLYKTRIKKGWTPEEAATIPKGGRNYRINPEKDIAIYYKDDFVIWGTLDEVAKKLDKPVKTVRYWCTTSARKRHEFTGYYGIYIEED